jgi:hypothetical protein
MGGRISSTTVATVNVRGRMFTVTRIEWRDSDGLSFDVTDTATGQCLTPESYDKQPSGADIFDLLNRLAEDLENGSLDPFFDDDGARAALAEITKPQQTTSPRRCFFIPVEAKTEHGYIPSMVTEGEPGHTPMSGNGPAAAPWYWGTTYEQAKAVATEANGKLGHSPTDVMDILLSSGMFDSH